jgi:hypothetical protein
VALKGRVFWGQKGLKEGNLNSVEACQALCSSDPLCTGATYNSAKAYCWTRAGSGDVATGLDTDYAIISEVKQNADLISELNNRLINLNDKIKTVLVDIVPEEEAEVKVKNAKQANLQSIYQQLLADRKKIEEMIEEYRMLDQRQDDTSLYVEQNNIAYILWFVFAIIIVVYTLKLQLFPNIAANPFRVIFWFILAVLFIVVTMYLNSAPGFFLWGIIIMLVSFMQMKIIPSP